MIVSNPELAGRKTALTGGLVVTFDAKGLAEVPDTCGLIGPNGDSRVRGFTLVSGKPAVQFEEGTKVLVARDGALAFCLGPADMAGRRTSCPDGHTVAAFNAQRLALVPNTCGLDSVPGYQYLATTDAQEAQAEAQRLTGSETPVAVEDPRGIPSATPLEHVRRLPGLVEQEARDAAQSAKDSQSPAAQDPRIRHGSDELPLPTPSPRPSGVAAADESVEQPLVPMSDEEQAAAQSAQEAGAADLPPAVAAQLEGSAPVAGLFACPFCDRDDFKNKQGLDAHVHGHRRNKTDQPRKPEDPGAASAAAVIDVPPTAPTAQAAAVAAAMAAIDG